MFGKKKTTQKIDKEQLELIENAQKRIKQKKRLYTHFVVFLIGAVFLIITNIVLGVGNNITFFGKEWFLYAILIWSFLFIYHAFNVFVTHKFLGKKWEQQQLNKLVAKQKARLAKLEQTLPADETLLANQQREAETKTVKKKSKQQLTIIVAAGEDNAIGKDNDLIWHLSDDLKRFKQLTSGHHIIMGRKTFESFPKPLPNRTHVVITRQHNYKVPTDVIVVHNLEDALDAVKSDSQPFIIGGGEIYKQAINLADKIELTRVHDTFKGADTFFPEIDLAIWEESQKSTHPKDNKHAHAFSFITYIKK